MPVPTPDALLAARAERADLDARRDELVAGPAARGLRREVLGLDARLGALTADLAARIDPCDASPDVPLVLLPVRVSTKLVKGTSTLQVRISPDEVHVDSLDRRLTEAEQAAGQAYWDALWPATPDELADGSLATAARADLTAAVGPRRTGWVAAATQPTNLRDRPQGVAPELPPTPTEVALGQVARCLPDQFVVTVQPRGAQPVTVVGAPVPRDVAINPVSLDDEEASGAAGLTVPLGSEWTVDFAAAVAVGLGVEVTLPPGTTHLDHVVVVGTRRTSTEERNAADLGELLRSHRYSDGLSLLPAGTPTNNADADRSPYQPSRSAAPPDLTSADASTGDAARLGALLGVDPTPLGLSAGAGPSQETAEDAANTALWFATWGPVLGRFEESQVPGVTAGTVESARRLHRDHARGAGPVPALRVGAQPYGVLPVADLARWVPRAGESTASAVRVITTTLARWTEAAGRKVPRVRPGEDVSDADLLEILGTSPAALSVRGRIVGSGPLRPYASATGAPARVVEADQHRTQAVLAQYSVAAARLTDPPSPDQESRSIGLPLSSSRDPEVIAAILAGQSPAVDSVLQALLDVAWDEACRTWTQAQPDRYLPPLLDLLTLDAATRRLVEVAGAGPRVAAEVNPGELHAAAEQVVATRFFDDQPVDRPNLAAFEPVAAVRTSLAAVALDLGDTGEARWVGSAAIGAVLAAAAAAAEVRAAMTALAGCTTEQRGLATAHALDLAAHRVDAWATGLATARLRDLTAAEPVGLTLGAFGYVEEIAIGIQPDGPQGWLHAPSGNHAVAAGLLASAHRSRVGARDGVEPFAIDLSSRRGPELRRVLQGVAGGQPIGSLLGYQIERGLTGSAARCQLGLRQLAPLTTGVLVQDEGEQAGEDDLAARAAAAVTDGAALLARYWPDRLADLRQALDQPPKDVFVEQWAAVTDAEWATISAALQGAADTLDVVSDALLSEAVLQYASGSPARASAALDALGSGGSIEPELGVLDVAQGGRVLTHAVLAAIPADAPSSWSAGTPRARCEPRLEAWAARRLGDPGAVVLTVQPARHTLAEAGLGALDLVFADDFAALERRVRAAVPELGDAALVTEPEAGWAAGEATLVQVAGLAASLRPLVSDARSVVPTALVRGGEPVQRRFDLDELLLRCDALVAGLAVILDAGTAAMGAVDPETFTVADADQAAAVAAAVGPLADVGIPLQPQPARPTDVGWAWGAWLAAQARHTAAVAALERLRDPDRAEPATQEETLDVAAAVAGGVLGDGFTVLPLLVPIAPGGPDDLVAAVGAPAFAPPPPAALNAFLRDHATVLSRVGQLAEAQLVGRALGRGVSLTALQLGERDAAGAPAAGTDRWLAGPLPDDRPWPAGPVTHLVAELVTAPGADPATALADGFAALAVDGWVETLPFQPGVRAFDPEAPANPLRAARATTGLAVHAHQASARAPQVLLSAVSADQQRWTAESLRSTVLAAVGLAKARLVTYEHVPGDGAVLPAAYVASPWLQPSRGLWFRELSTHAWVKTQVPFLSEMPG